VWSDSLHITLLKELKSIWVVARSINISALTGVKTVLIISLVDESSL